MWEYVRFGLLIISLTFMGAGILPLAGGGVPIPMMAGAGDFGYLDVVGPLGLLGAVYILWIVSSTPRRKS